MDNITEDIDISIKVLYHFEKPDGRFGDIPYYPGHVKIDSLEYKGIELPEDIQVAILEDHEESFLEKIIDDHYNKERGEI